MSILKPCCEQAFQSLIITVIFPLPSYFQIVPVLANWSFSDRALPNEMKLDTL